MSDQAAGAAAEVAELKRVLLHALALADRLGEQVVAIHIQTALDILGGGDVDLPPIGD